MSDVFLNTIFLDSQPNIITNKNLRGPQRFAYSALCEHFLVEKSKEDALVVLPTGERVIIVMGAINALASRVSGTFIQKFLCIA